MKPARKSFPRSTELHLHTASLQVQDAGKKKLPALTSLQVQDASKKKLPALYGTTSSHHITTSSKCQQEKASRTGITTSSRCTSSRCQQEKASRTLRNYILTSHHYKIKNASKKKLPALYGTTSSYRVTTSSKCQQEKASRTRSKERNATRVKPARKSFPHSLQGTERYTGEASKKKLPAIAQQEKASRKTLK
jgi:hypothetical protein